LKTLFKGKRLLLSEVSAEGENTKIWKKPRRRDFEINASRVSFLVYENHGGKILHLGKVQRIVLRENKLSDQ